MHTLLQSWIEIYPDAKVRLPTLLVWASERNLWPQRFLAENVGGNRAPQEPKNVAEAYREMYPLLHRFCQVEILWKGFHLFGAGLPQCKRHIAVNSAAGAEQGLYRERADTQCVQPCGHIEMQLVTSLYFVGNGQDNIVSGCQQFLVKYTGTDDHY